MMPNRILKESITTSATLARLSADEERFFLRLTVVVDDYGRMDARPCILRAKCFAAMLGRVTDVMVARWLQKLVTAGLVYVYEIQGEPFLQLATWERHQITRAKRSKYPAPPDGMRMHADASRCEQMHANVSVFGIGNGNGIDIGIARKGARAKPKTPWPEGWELTDELAAYATRQGLDAKYQWGKFQAHAQRDDARHVNWTRAWEYWVRNAWEIANRRHG